jgi:unspecific monooxygenase
MLDSPATDLPVLPAPPRVTRERGAAEAFLVLRRNPLELWGERAYELDAIPGQFLGRKQLLLNDPAGIRHVLVTNHENYGRNIGTRRVLRPVLGAGLFLAEGEPWRHQRRTIAPSFAPRTMPILARHVVRASAEHEARLAAAAGRPVELLPRLQALALDIAGRSMFSLEVAAFGAELRAMLMDYARRHAQPGVLDLLLPAHMRSPEDVGREKFRTRWLALMDRVIAARRAQPGDPDRPRDLFDLLDAARDPQTGAGFSHAQLRDEVSTLILAGHETTAVTLFWACYAAAMIPGQQARLAAEADAADLDEAANPAALPLIRAHVDEALRLYPPAFLIVREARGADEVAGFRIAPGTVVSISPWVLHRHRKHWTAPDAFDPGRFAPDAPAPERFVYLPFGAGPRICVGMQFALTEAVLVLARLLRSFHIELIGGHGVRPRGFVTTQPDRPVYFALTRRKARPALH